MGTSWEKNARVEVYDFEGDAWRRAVVLDPAYVIAGYPYLQVGLVDVEGEPFLWIAPELVGEHVRPAD